MENKGFLPKRPRRPPPKPKPEPPVGSKGGPQQPTSYGEKVEEKTTEPEAVTPTSPEEGVPQGSVGIHEGPPDTPPAPTPRPWRHHWGKWDVVALVVIIALGVVTVNYFEPFGSSSSGIPKPAVPPPVSVEEGVPQTGAGGTQAVPPAQEEGVPQPVAVVNHWVSATPGKGMRQWTVYTNGYEWWEGDVDLRGGTTGSLTFTVTAINPDLMEVEIMRSLIGVKIIYNIETWKDNGTTIEFTAKYGEGAQIVTFQLTRTPDGHLTGRVQAPETTERVWFEAPSDWEDSEVPMPTSGWTESTSPAIEGTLDLVPAP